jgi:hypothetical protein
MTDLCKKCGLPITYTRGAVTYANERTGSTTHDLGPYHFPECMPPTKWNSYLDRPEGTRNRVDIITTDDID